MDALLRRRIMMMAGGGVPPTPPDPPVVTTSFTMASADLFAGKTCGGYINITSGKWVSNSTYRGVIIDLRGYEGGQITFTRAADATMIRYAYLTASTFQSNSLPAYSASEGYTSQITNDIDLQFVETIPADAHYMYVYVKSSSTNVAPTIEVSGAFQSKDVDLPASLFETNTTIGANGSVYTGSSAPTVVCTGYLSVADYAFCQQIQFKVNRYPSGVDTYRLNVAEYTTGQTFIRRDTYTDAPYTQQLAPECAFVRIMVVCKAAGEELSGDVVRFDNNDIQVSAINR